MKKGNSYPNIKQLIPADNLWGKFIQEDKSVLIEKVAFLALCEIKNSEETTQDIIPVLIDSYGYPLLERPDNLEEYFYSKEDPRESNYSNDLMAGAI